MRPVLDQIKYVAEHDPFREASVGLGANCDYQSLYERIQVTADALLQSGTTRLGLRAQNTLSWAIVDLAASANGITVVPIPLFFSEAQTKHLTENSQLDTVFSDSPWPLPYFEEKPAGNLDGRFYSLRAPNQSAVSFSKITYTSGSTGTPKGACLDESTMMTIVGSLSAALASTVSGRHLCLLPFATLLENVAGLYLAWFMERSVVIDDPTHLGLDSNHVFDAQRFAGAVSTYQPDSVILLPQMLKQLLESDSYQSLSSLKFIAVGGGKVAPELLERAGEVGLPVYEGYGLTECGSCVALNTPQANKTGSVGKPLPHAQIRFSPRGEILVTGAAMQGYLDDAPANTEIATGDVGHVDEDGFLFVTGRIKNVIISSFGRNISPEWVESFFLANPFIHQIAVFGEAQPHLSAVIVPSKHAAAARIAEAVAAINLTLPDYARIMQWVVADDPFHVDNGLVTNNGKLRRAAIATKYDMKYQNIGDAA